VLERCVELPDVDLTKMAEALDVYDAHVVAMDECETNEDMRRRCRRSGTVSWSSSFSPR